jgi:hypothetical protein
MVVGGPQNGSLDEAESWKRGSVMHEKTALQMVERRDGIIRYSKTALVELNTKDKVCPQDVRERYPRLSLIERGVLVPPDRHAGPNSPSKSPRGGNSGHHGGRGKYDQSALEAPHPDELKIFSADNLQREDTFR